MKKLVMIILLVWVANAAHSQQYFNVRDPLHSLSTILTSTVEYNGKYYCTGICLDSTEYYNGTGLWALKFSVFDAAGNKIKDTFYQKSGRNMDAWSSTLTKLPGGEFIVGAEAVDTSQWYLMLFRFDSTGKLLAEKEFQKPFCSGLKVANDLWRLRDLKPDGNGNWLMLSSINCVTSRANMDFLLTKLDSSFNVIWHQKYGHATLNNIPSKLLIEPDGYVLAGGRNDVNWFSMGFTCRAEIIKVDTAGSVLWSYYSPQSRLTNYIEDIIKTQDGGYIYCGLGDGVEVVSANGSSSDIYWKGWVEKIDINRNVVWNKAINNELSNWESTNQTALKELPNGDIIVAGSLWQKISPSDTELYHFGSITKLDALGNQVWQRAYRYNNDTLVYLVYAMESTSDGGYIMCGEARDEYYPYSYPRQQGWLIKVDSNGCTNPQCLFTSIPEEPKTYNSITIYPNPANDVLKVQCTEPLKNAMFYLYDVTGRLVKSQNLKQGTTEIAIQDFPVGIYLYKVREEKAIITQGKIVKE